MKVLGGNCYLVTPLSYIKKYFFLCKRHPGKQGVNQYGASKGKPLSELVRADIAFTERASDWWHFGLNLPPSFPTCGLETVV